MTSDPESAQPTRPPGPASVTALRPRRTFASVAAGGQAAVRHDLSAAGREGLRRIAGDRPAEELVVLSAAAAVVLAAAEESDLVGFTVHGPRGAVTCSAALDRLGTVADLVLALDAQLSDPVAAGSDSRYGLSTAALAFGAPAQDESALALLLDPPGSRPRGVTARVATNVIDPWFAEVFLRGLDCVLAEFSEPRCPLAKPQVLTRQDADDVARWSRQSFQPAPDGETLLSRILRQAAAHPERVAVTSDGCDVTYGELVLAAGRAVARLHRVGVGAGDRVALMAAKSPHVVPAILGILRAGAAYVPLDAAAPAQRLKAILTDAQCAALIGPPSVPEELGTALPHLSEQELTAPDAQAGSGWLPPEPAPEAHAYVIYTSGSTGEPKGVLVRHGAIASYLAWKLRYHDLGPATSLLQVPSLSFDSSVSDVFSVLGAGGRLVLVDERTRLDPAAVLSLGERYGITHLTLVPSLYRVLIGALAGFPALRQVTVAGEAMPPALAAEHARRLPGVRLVNEYGPTENSVGATAFDYTRPESCAAVPGGDPPISGGFPIGRPIDNTVAEVLDREGRGLPAGFPGELHLAGPGLADGYLGRPDETARAFAQAPDLPGGRRYATGDRAWWLPDGRLEFLGRADDQIKIRGHRVELGGVEAALAALPGVESAAVVTIAEADTPTVRGLAGYVVADVEGDRRDLRRELRAAIPAYMVPDRISVLPAMPLTANGKIDRAVLAAQAAADMRPAILDPALAADPRRLDQDTETTAEVARFLAMALKIPALGPGADFFDAGGHSLLAVEALVAVEARFGVRVTLDEFFAAPNADGVSALVLSRHPAAPGAEPSLPTAAEQDDYPLSPAQRQFWLLDRLEGAGPRHNLVEAFWIEPDPEAAESGPPGPPGLDESAVGRALAAELLAHDVLHSRIVTIGGEPRVRLAPAGIVPLRIVTALPDADLQEQADLLIEQEYACPFDLAADAPARAAVLRVGERMLLVLTVHHIAVEGESAATFVRHIFDRIRAERVGERFTEEAIARYLDYSVWSAARRTPEAVEKSRDHWLRVFRDGPAFPLLPADGTRGQPPGFGDHVAVTLTEPVTGSVRAAARRYGVTDFALLLACAAQTMHRLAGLRTVDFGTPVGLRDHPACRGVLGPFANFVVMRTRVDPAQPFRETVAAAHAAVTDALAHRDYPIDDLIAAVPGSRDGGRTPLFTVKFSVDERHAPGTSPGRFFDLGPGLRVQRCEANLDTAPYELTLHADNTGPALCLVAEYDTTLFSRARAERIVGHWADLVARSPEPERRLVDMPLPEPEQERLAQLAARRSTVLPAPGSLIPREVSGPGLVITNADNVPAPLGVAGDIVLGAPGIARRGRIPTGPYTPTGWSGAWREDGTLQLRGAAGRIVSDHLGLIDPAEAELLLRSHPGVAQVQVESGPDGRLSARVRAAGLGQLAPQDLRAYLRGYLPARFVPEPITLEEQGIGSREAVTDDGTSASTGSDDRPAGLIAVELAAVLGLETVEPHDDFFALGGSSLDALRLASRLSRCLGQKVAPQTILATRTPRALAAALGAGSAIAPAKSGPRPGLAKERAPLSAEQSQLLAALLTGVQESIFAIVECFRLAGVDEEALRRAVASVVSRHDALSSRLVKDARGHHWERSAAARFGWSRSDLSALAGAEGRAALNDAVREHVHEPFDLAAGLIVRVLLVALAGDEYIVACAMHHLCVDGRSVGIVLSEIGQRYAFERDHGPARPPSLPPAVLSAGDVYAWQAAIGNQAQAVPSSGWRRLLGGPASEPALPYDRPRLTRAALMPAEISCPLPARCASAVRRLSSALGATDFMTVFAAFAVLAAAPDGTIRLATTVSMRGRPELAEVVGLLSTTAVLGFHFTLGDGFADVLTQVRDALLDAHSAADEPFAVVAEAIEQEQGIDRADLASILIEAYEPPAPPGGWLSPGPLTGLVRPLATAYHLAVSIMVGPGGVDCAVTYRQELFEPETVLGFFDRLGVLICDLADRPDVPLAQIRGLSAAFAGPEPVR